MNDPQRTSGKAKIVPFLLAENSVSQAVPVIQAPQILHLIPGEASEREQQSLKKVVFVDGIASPFKLPMMGPAAPRATQGPPNRRTK